MPATGLTLEHRQPDRRHAGLRPGNGDGNGNYSLSGQVNATSDSSGNPTVISATQVSLAEYQC